MAEAHLSRPPGVRPPHPHYSRPHQLFAPDTPSKWFAMVSFFLLISYFLSFFFLGFQAAIVSILNGLMTVGKSLSRNNFRRFFCGFFFHYVKVYIFHFPFIGHCFGGESFIWPSQLKFMKCSAEKRCLSSFGECGNVGGS